MCYKVCSSNTLKMPTIQDLPLDIVKMIIEDYDCDDWSQASITPRKGSIIDCKRFWKLYEGNMEYHFVYPIHLSLKIVNNNVILSSCWEGKVGYEYSYFKTMCDDEAIITQCEPKANGHDHDMIEWDPEWD